MQVHSRFRLVFASAKHAVFNSVCNCDQNPDCHHGTILPLEHETLFVSPFAPRRTYVDPFEELQANRI